MYKYNFGRLLGNKHCFNLSSTVPPVQSVPCRAGPNVWTFDTLKLQGVSNWKNSDERQHNMSDHVLAFQIKTTSYSLALITER